MSDDEAELVVDFPPDYGPETYTSLPFPPYRKDHIIYCSVGWWYPRYRSVTPKARLIELTPAFVSYLHEDGIFVPDDDEPKKKQFEANDEVPDPDDDPKRFAAWSDVHEEIKAKIRELGGKVAPKLNWSAPKDSTWINPTNSMACERPSDIYLLLKSSEFITHDLDSPFDGCEDTLPTAHQEKESVGKIPYFLMLRKWILFNPSVEFRCFVRNRTLIGICQRDLNHFDFLFEMQDQLRNSIQEFFDQELKETFRLANFTFDVYIPFPHDRVWLVDFNPWAPRTDPLLFSWLELLTMPVPLPAPVHIIGESFIRRTLNESCQVDVQGIDPEIVTNDEDDDDDDEDIIELFRPQFRLVKKDDPEAYSFHSPQYSAHKLPKDVVDASQGGAGALKDFAEQWKAMVEQREKEDIEDDSDD